MTNELPTATAGSTRRIAAIGLAVFLALGVAFSAIMQKSARGREEATASSHAELLAETILVPQLAANDLSEPLSDTAYNQFEQTVRDRILSDGILSVTVVKRDGTVVFSTDRSLVGRDLSGQLNELPAILGGTTKTVVADQPGAASRTLEIFVPLRLRAGGPVSSAAEIIQDYGPIVAAASRPWQAIEILFAILFLACCLTLVPLSFRTGRSRSAGQDGSGKVSPGTPGLADEDAAKELLGKLRQTEERARTADAMYRQMAEQLRESQEKLRESEKGQRAILDEARQTEDRAREHQKRFDATEVALRNARERLGKLEDRLKKAEAGDTTGAAAAVLDPDTEQRLRIAEERLVKAQEQLAETEAVKATILQQARSAEERARQAEQHAKEAQAGRAAIEEQARRERDESRGDLDAQLIALRDQLSAADVERQRLGTELVGAHERLRDSQEHLRQTQEAARSLVEELREVKDTTDRSGELAAADERAQLAEARAEDLDGKLHQAAEHLQHLIEELKVSREQSAGAAELERRTLAAEARAAEAEQRATQIEQLALAAEAKVVEIERRAGTDNGKPRQNEQLRQAEEQIAHIMAQLHAAEERALAAEAQALSAEAKAAEAAERASEAEARTPLSDEQARQREGIRSRGASNRSAFQERLRQATGQPASPETAVQEAEEKVALAEQRAALAEERLQKIQAQLAATQDASPGARVEASANGELRDSLQAAVASEIRSPLTSILGATLALKHQETSSPEGKDLVRQLAASARKLDRLVSDLLEVDQLADGTLVPNRRRSDLEALVRRVVEESRTLVDRQVTVETTRAVAAVDPGRAEQMIESLLNNAARRTSSGGSVWVRVASEQEGATIAVEDDGPEIRSELRESLFAKLQDRPNAARSQPNGGTGLALLARLAEIHGGRAWVEERPGGGASFRVFLPDAPAEESKDAQEERDAAAEASAG